MTSSIVSVLTWCWYIVVEVFICLFAWVASLPEHRIFICLCFSFVYVVF